MGTAPPVAAPAPPPAVPLPPLSPAPGSLAALPHALTVGQWLTAWLQDWVAPTRAPKTVRDYTGLTRHYLLPSLGALPLTALAPGHIQQLLAQLLRQGKAPRTVQYVHAVLRAALNEALRQGLLPRNPAQPVRPPRGARLAVAPLRPAEARALLAAFQGHPLEALVATALTLGLRLGECLALRWADLHLDLERGTVTVRHQLQRRPDGTWHLAPLKTRRNQRTLVLPPFLVRLLLVQRERVAAARQRAGAAWQELDLVFPNRVGQPRHGTRVTHAFQEQLRRRGLRRLRFHDLRHGCASLLASQGATLRDLMKQLGHSTITVTGDLYVHLTPERSRELAQRMAALLDPTSPSGPGPAAPPAPALTAAPPSGPTPSAAVASDPAPDPGSLEDPAAQHVPAQIAPPATAADPAAPTA
jgi:integrase